MKKAFPIALMILGLVFVGAGIYSITEGFEARDQVKHELLAQNIVTPEDASIPNAQVNDVATAQAMADVIDKHARESTGGLTYSELDREDPKRQVAFQASTLRTSLYSSIMAFRVSELVVGLGAMMLALGVAVGGLGVALAGLAIPSVARKLHVNPVAAEPAAA